MDINKALKIVAMIPARTGSKGLPNKNIKNLCGRPLISYSIEAALGCKEINEVFLNSDSQAILNIGSQFGAQSFLRSKDLAGDETSMKLVIIDFIDSLQKQNFFFDAVIVLYPVYPLRNSTDLTNMIREFMNIGGKRPLIGMKAPKTHPFLCYKLNGNNTPESVIEYDANVYYRRQQYPIYFEINHWACILPVESLPTLNAQLMNKGTYGYVIPGNVPSVNIDTPEDFQFAEFLLQKDMVKE